MKPGIALENTLTGMPDFIGSDEVITLHYGGPGKIIECLKCPNCGFSIYKNHDVNMSWNYRVMAHQGTDLVYFQIHSVYYDEDHNPTAYSSEPTIPFGESPEELKVELSLFMQALSKPVLWYGDRWPEEYKE